MGREHGDPPLARSMPSGSSTPHRRCWSGDEEEWEIRHLRAGGRIRYVAAAALDHRRAPRDARFRR